MGQKIEKSFNTYLVEYYHKLLNVLYNILVIQNNIYVGSQKYKALNHEYNTDNNY